MFALKIWVWRPIVRIVINMTSKDNTKIAQIMPSRNNCSKYSFKYICNFVLLLSMPTFIWVTSKNWICSMIFYKPEGCSRINSSEFSSTRNQVIFFLRVILVWIGFHYIWRFALINIIARVHIVILRGLKN